MEDLVKLVRELCAMTNETQWLEFKHDNYDPEMIGRDISALANSAALYEREHAYMIWGVDDQTHDIVGTEHDLLSLKKGGQELESWLRTLLSDNARFEFASVIVDGRRVGVLTIYPAYGTTVTFQKNEYIRIGSYTKPLGDAPASRAPLWQRLHGANFEEQLAMTDLSLHDALSLLDHGVYFDMTGTPTPDNANGIAHYLAEERIISRQDNGTYAITNLGALLFAKRLRDFPQIVSKAVRVVQYDGTDRVDILKEMTVESGYAAGFNGMMQYVEALLPSREVITSTVRETKREYPPAAVREAIANALIHQDFSVRGSCVLVEIFANRIEVTNPGRPLVDVMRLIDNPPRTRNTMLAALMRRLNLCEELGTGWDRMTLACEKMHMPAPRVDLYDENMKVCIFAARPFAELTSQDRLWSCYLHTCVMFVNGQFATNASLRERFGDAAPSTATISRLIKEAVEKRYIRPFDPDTAPRYMKYIPAWA